MRHSLFAVLLLTSTTAVADAEITGCHDGDTCRLVSGVYTGDVHLFCVDAPGLGQAPWGVRALDAIQAEVRGTIRVLVDSLDGQSRPVVEFIRDDGWNLGLELVRAGYAAVHPERCDEPEYHAVQEDARLAKVGIWQVDGLQQRPWEWKRMER
jgi:endonuclease YncB( thermonuclease family)